ncbi:hypothetical protein HOLleu_03922 [Holothuria leucospilota]|uniref:Uncharacterized protein n=1 Tax=Holothuria leucospilota TaxID=206669 RepID=A0A9Q1HLK9_HOLLE|nr:hypothetical protein HOLleu_03922 [Holothuria leucospilota]
MQGPLSCRVSANFLRVISERLVMLQQSFSREFARKPRSLFEVKHWKATEFRTFLLYTGPVVLHGTIPGALYRNFLTLSVAMRILLNPAISAQYLQYAEDLLKVFVQNFGTVYGKQYLVYNVHSLIHLGDDARKFGALDDISAFPFESFLGHLKKLVRGPHYPLSQIVHRIIEKQELLCNTENVKSVQLHKKPHLHGPLPREYCHCKQCRQYCGQLFVPLSASHK